MDRLFLDANVLFSAAHRPDAGLQRFWRLAGVRLLTSDYAAAEARRNLAAPGQAALLDKLLRGVEVGTLLPPGSHPPPVSLAAKDLPILMAAIQMRATHLLTGDKRHFGGLYGRSIGGVRVVSPRDYLRG